MADAARRADIAAALADPLVQQGRLEALVAELLRAGKAPVLAAGLVPLAELGVVRVGLFGEAGGVAAPGFEGWLPTAVVDEVRARHAGLVAGCWDGGLEAGWSLAWTDAAAEGLVAWTAQGGRLRLADGVVDLLDDGRWTVIPAERVARVSLQGLPEQRALLRLHTTDGRFVAMRAGRALGAGLLVERLARALGVEAGGSRWDR